MDIDGLPQPGAAAAATSTRLRTRGASAREAAAAAEAAEAMAPRTRSKAARAAPAAAVTAATTARRRKIHRSAGPPPRASSRGGGSTERTGAAPQRARRGAAARHPPVPLRPQRAAPSDSRQGAPTGASVPVPPPPRRLRSHPAPGLPSTTAATAAAAAVSIATAAGAVTGAAAGLSGGPPGRNSILCPAPRTPPRLASIVAVDSDNGEEEKSGKLETPRARWEGDCAICLSPLKEAGGDWRRQEEQQEQQQQQQGVYRIQECGHNFHRACLAANRRAGNAGCPYCRGPLERGLTPTPTAEERRATYAREALSEARERALDSAVAAMVEVRGALTTISEAGSAAAAAVVSAAGAATAAARSTQEAVGTMLSVVRSNEPSVALYAAVTIRLHVSRTELSRTLATLTAASASQGGGGVGGSSGGGPAVV